MRRNVAVKLPVTRVGAILWAWKNRERIADWASFAVRSLRHVASGGSRDDIVAEARIRAQLGRARRGAASPVTVEVRDGVAKLDGRLPAEAHAALQDLVVGTRGVRRVDDRIATVGVGGPTRKRRRGILRRRR